MGDRGEVMQPTTGIEPGLLLSGLCLDGTGFTRRAPVPSLLREWGAGGVPEKAPP